MHLVFVLKEFLQNRVRFGLMAVAVGLVVSLTMLMSAMSEGLITGMTGAKGSLDADALVFQGDTQFALERNLELGHRAPRGALRSAVVKGQRLRFVGAGR